MTDAQQKKAAREFTVYWKDKGYEKGESQPFWLSLHGLRPPYFQPFANRREGFLFVILFP